MASGAYGWKVGFTTHMRQRAIDLVSVSRDVEFVAATHGRRRDESNIHRALRHHALSGGREWYPDSDEVRAYLTALSFAWRGSVRWPRKTGWVWPVGRWVLMRAASW